MIPQGISLTILRGKKGDTAYFKMKEYLGDSLFVMNKAMTENFLNDRVTPEVFIYYQAENEDYPNSFIVKFIPENFRNISCMNMQMLQDIRADFEDFYNFLQEKRLLPRRNNEYIDKEKWEYIMMKMNDIIYEKGIRLEESNLQRWF